jgi:hypothetical protein
LSDWFLPSKDELNRLYSQKATVGVFVENFFWSSSESSADLAWVQIFFNGSQSDGGFKVSTFYVRPVRAF